MRCLRSLLPEVESGRASVHVIDNGSTDGSLEAARTEAPWAKTIDAGANLGFGRAVNLVARRTRSTWLVAANADIALEPGALSTLLRAGSEPWVGCVAPRLVLPSGATQHSVHPFPTMSLALIVNLGLYWLIPSLGDRLCLEGHWNSNRRRNVPWAIGAFLLLRRAAFAQAGGFDEGQWMYAEDLELGWRLRDRGWTIRYEPTARVLHEQSPATDAAFGDEKILRFMAASYAVVGRRHGPAYARALALMNVAGATARLAWAVPASSFSDRWRGRRAMSRSWLAAHAQALGGLDAVPNNVVHPGLLGGWGCRSHPAPRRRPDEDPR